MHVENLKIMTFFQGLLSDGRTLWLRKVNLHNSGKYSCEVIAEYTFHTLIKSAHMQVVGEIFKKMSEKSWEPKKKLKN